MRSYTQGKRATKGYKNRDMNDETYKLRRAVIDIMYEFKDRYSIPRQTVRIVDRVHGTETHDGWHNVIGYAGMGGNYVHILSSWAGKSRRKLLPLVAHEVCHSVKAIEHDDNCLLMSPIIVDMTEEQVWKHCDKYLK
tara:strand:- start:298 stop:708 length:411 start_codon:yes stop_codon:yes gene_type:complete